MICLTSEAVTEKNVRILIHVDSFINRTEQMLYVYQLNGNNYKIDDSVKIEPCRNLYEVHADVPFETTVRLLFSKCGPLHLQILANPKDILEVEITKADQKVGISQKRLLNGTSNQNAFVDFWSTIHSINNEKRKAEQALSVYGTPVDLKSKFQITVDSCNQAEVEYERNIIISSSSPYTVRAALNLIKEHIQPNDYLELVKTAYNRFPTYYPIKLIFNGGTWTPADKESTKARRLIRNVERNRIMQKPINLPQCDSLSIGEKLNLTLIDSVGTKQELLSYTGTYILIELWASWCLPCIQAMPNIIFAQKKYINNLVCCAISIDNDAKAWKRCIERERLQTLHHFKGTNENGEVYDELKRLIIKGTIPQNYLLDREGKIIAINIYGEELIKKLEELTKK